VEWPLIGRRELLERTVAALAAGRGGGLVLHGPAGIGKSRLLAAAGERAERRGIDVRWVLATAASQAVPFGPFAHLLPPRLDATRPGGVLGVVTASLTSAPGRVALAVDDAHLLDAASAALLQHVAQSSAIAMVVTVRDTEVPPDAVTALWKDLGLAKVVVEALLPDEVRAVVGRTLGGDVSSSLVDDLVRLSHGNPLLLRELVTAAVGSGALHRRDEVWVAAGSLVASDDLPATIAARLDRLPPRLRAGAELVAFAEPVGASIVEELLDADVRARLDEERLLEAVPQRRRVELRLTHPLYSEALRATTPPLRAREHARRLAEMLGRTGLRRREDRLRVAVWHLAAGRRDRPELYRAACHDAHAAEDHELAARLAEAAVEGGGGLRAEVALLRQQPYLGQLAAAQAHAEELAAAVTDPAEVVEVAVVRAHLHVVDGDIRSAQRVLRQAETAATSPELRERILTQVAATAHSAGDVVAAVDAVDRMLAGDLLGPDLLIAAARIGVRALATAGREEDAVRLADRALDAIDEVRTGSEMVRAEIAMARCQAVAYRGRFDLAVADGEHGAAASRGGLRGAWKRDVGQALLAVGRPRSALVALREMMAELPLSGASAASALWALDAMAEACALLGDLDAARRHLDDLAMRRPAAFQLPRTGGAVATAAVGGELKRARELALDAAAGHAGRGAIVPQAQAMYDVARFGAPAEVAADLERLAGSSQGRFVPALARAARRLANRDGAGLDASSQELEQQGLALLAAELATQASRLHRRGGSPTSAVSASRRAAVLADACEGASTPLLADRDRTGWLTEREWEVATLVARGLADREVAERLHLSVRTVHSHLHHTYRKLHISGRDELARALHPDRTPRH
jgi:DNA-binding CsgD family transcriptional regulator